MTRSPPNPACSLPALLPAHGRIEQSRQDSAVHSCWQKSLPLRHWPMALPSSCSTFPGATLHEPPKLVSLRLPQSLPIHPSPCPRIILQAVSVLVARDRKSTRLNSSH